MSARAWALALLLASAGCGQSDLVATSWGGAPCTNCEPAGECAARACGPLESRAALCANGQPPVQAGDSCAEGESSQGSRYALCSCSDLVTPALLSVDAYTGTLARPATGAAALGINGSLHAEQGGQIDGALLASGPVTGGALELTGELREHAPPPCDCADSHLLDIAALVSAAGGANDNAAAGLTARELDGFDGDRELTLPCGRYFVTRLAGAGALTIRAQGHVALFVEGNIELDQELALLPAADAQLSVFVAGDMRVGGAFRLGGDPNTGSRGALYLASSGSLALRGSTTVVGSLYAPRAELVTVGDIEVYGSLFVRRAAPGGDVVLHQDVAAEAPAQCGE